MENNPTNLVVVVLNLGLEVVWFVMLLQKYHKNEHLVFPYLNTSLYT